MKRLKPGQKRIIRKHLYMCIKNCTEICDCIRCNKMNRTHNECILQRNKNITCDEAYKICYKLFGVKNYPYLIK